MYSRKADKTLQKRNVLSAIVMHTQDVQKGLYVTGALTVEHLVVVQPK